MGGARRLGLALLVAGLAAAVALGSLQRNRPLQPFMAEEYFLLGWNLHACGQLTPCPGDPLSAALPAAARDEASPFFRPPGYPAFVALALWLGGVEVPAPGTPLPALQATLERAGRVVLQAQALALALAAGVLFLLLSRRLRPGLAAPLALLFGTSPYLVVLSTLHHYEVFHALLLLLALLPLTAALEAPAPRRGLLLLAGAAFGLATLTRPTSLVMPAVLLAVLLVARWPLGRAARAAAVFGLGLALAVGPWTARNFALTGRFIPVNAQGGVAVWAATAVAQPRAPGTYRWWSAWYAQGLPVFQRVTGLERYDAAAYNRQVLELEDAFRAEALHNLRERPGVYLGNVAVNALTYTVDVSSVLLQVFGEVQRTGRKADPRWVAPGRPADFHPAGWARALDVFVAALTALAVVGVVTAVQRRDPAWLAPAVGFLTFLVGHALSWMDLFYYYVKLPFLFALAGLALQAADGLALPLPGLGRSVRASTALLSALGALGAALTVGVLFG